MILEKQIPRVVVGSLDPNPRVAGSGLKRLMTNGVEVCLAADATPFVLLNKGFWMSQLEGRPWVTLKWAQTPEGMMGDTHKRLKITGPAANCAVHRLRATHAGIVVGRGTAAADRPSLTTRLHPGPNPTRIIVDSELKLVDAALPFAQKGLTLWVNTLEENTSDHIQKVKVEDTRNLSLILRSCARSLA